MKVIRQFEFQCSASKSYSSKSRNIDSYGLKEMLAFHLAAGAAFQQCAFVTVMVMSVCTQSAAFTETHTHTLKPQTTLRNNPTQMWGQIQQAPGHFSYIQHFPLFSTCFFFHLHNGSHSMALCVSFLVPDLVCWCSKFMLPSIFYK